MEEYKKKLQNRQLLSALGLLLTLAVVGVSRIVGKPPQSEQMASFVAGFYAGTMLMLVAVLVFTAVRSMLVARNPEKLKQMYIAETDERRQLIAQKSSALGMNLATFGLALAAMAAANLNTTVFFSLLGACLFLSLIRGALKIYYMKKY